MQPISIIVPVYNGERRLARMLTSLRSQSYEQSSLEVIVVDDHSTDGSVNVARSFGARVLENGTKNPERAKSIGIEAASNDLLLFLDDDNFLPHAGWLAKLVSAYVSNASSTGAQCAWFSYQPTDKPVNRYCCLFGMIDPLVYYLGRQDHLRYIDTAWNLSGNVLAERKDHWLVRFAPNEVPTIGSQGFLTRKSLLERIEWRPYFFHVDANYELSRLGFTDFTILKDSVGHQFGESLGQIFDKIRRNIRQYTRDSQIRSYKYEVSPPRIAWAFAKMLTVVLPLAPALKTYARTRDAASWLHPYVSWRVALIYLTNTPFQLLRNRFLRTT